MSRSLEAWSPFRGLDRFRRDFDDLVDRFLGGHGGELGIELSSPPLESFTEDGQLVIRADLPGIDPKDVEVTVHGDTLTLRGKRERRLEEKDRNFVHREISYGSFERSVALPEGVKPEDVKAAYKHGVLELRMPVPKAAAVAARKVPIEIESGNKTEKP